MWRVIGWTLLIGLSCAVSVAAGKESTDARRVKARTALEEASRLDQASPPDVTQTLNNLGQLRLAQGQRTEAVALYEKAFTLSEERLRQKALKLSEQELTRLLRSLRTDEERLYALVRASPDDPQARRLALAAALLRQGRSLQEAASTSRAIHDSLGPKDRDISEWLRDLNTQFATLSLQGPGLLSAADYTQRLAEITEQSRALKTELAKRSAALRVHNALPSPANIVGRVAASLPQDGVLITFIAYADPPLVLTPGAPAAQGPEPLRYLALVLFPDGRTRALDLGLASPIDSAAKNLHEALASKDVAYRALAQRLYALAFQPLMPLLGHTRRIYLAVDGQLHLVPFDALDDGSRSLIEVFEFTYLDSGAQLLRRNEELPSSRSMVVFADPTSTPSMPMPPSSESPLLTVAQRSSPAETPWVPLPGARQEALSIQRLFPQAQLFLGSDATQERLMSLSKPSILHVSTHGHFLDDARAPAGSRALGLVGTFSGNASTPPQDPMLRSGLVLSSSNGSRLNSRPAGTLVTSFELAGLDLWGTELVVLSACDTGRGEIELGQGIYGPRRALVIAGAETVVTSLWMVNDETTRLLMESYYRNLRAGQGRSEALRDAMLTLRKTYPHPHYWAPFITLGQDAPLRAFGPHPL
jgi:CHAT domain-containing protein